MAYFKIGPPVKVSGTGWDEKDKSNIAKIYIGRFENRFKFIQLLLFNEMGQLEFLVILILGGLSLKAEILNGQSFTCDSNDFKALRSFVDHLEFRIDEWNMGKDSSGYSNCCNWVGVTCMSSVALGLSEQFESGKVVKLDLSNRRLRGLNSCVITTFVEFGSSGLEQEWIFRAVSIALDYRFEFITGISGFYEDYCGSKYLRSICFHTNKAKYGPFIASPVNKGLEQTEFSYELGSKFDGFFGTFQKYGVESIGIYGKPVDKLRFVYVWMKDFQKFPTGRKKFRNDNENININNNARSRSALSPFSEILNTPIASSLKPKVSSVNKINIQSSSSSVKLKL
ncbi:hypothetical protein POM88_018560 [Heracleum sosnowskyi]|uniref:Jacalin-type lectin domain-containing protein n=1 Tax=Heracleum sosnowskyi TaxID=360622 RepID=A0AAD8IQS8_9APIA|nr:hypothetical protein POM88_018560 [Heracleum sosnowskyi]